MERKPLIGYDLDGVIAREPKFISRFYTPRLSWLAIRLRQFARPRYIPEVADDNYVIITNRPYTDAKLTYRWLAKFGIHPKKVYFYQGEKPCMDHMFKAEMIHKLGLEKFIESDRTQAEGLVLDCPDVNIRWVETLKVKP